MSQFNTIVSCYSGEIKECVLVTKNEQIIYGNESICLSKQIFDEINVLSQLIVQTDLVTHNKEETMVVFFCDLEEDKVVRVELFFGGFSPRGVLKDIKCWMVVETNSLDDVTYDNEVARDFVEMFKQFLTIIKPCSFLERFDKIKAGVYYNKIKAIIFSGQLLTNNG